MRTIYDIDNNKTVEISDPHTKYIPSKTNTDVLKDGSISYSLLYCSLIGIILGITAAFLLLFLIK